MSDELQPAAEWLTYKAAADRLGLQPTAVAARARRARWPKRLRNDTGEAEILVPGELLASPRQRPQEGRPAPAPDSEAPNVADAVRAAVGPLQAALERQERATEALQTALDIARAEVAAAQLEAAKADAMRQAAQIGADDLARRFEREETDRRELQRQADALRLELHAVLVDAARETGENRTKQASAAARIADLERQIAELTAKKARRWWQF